MKRYLVRGLDGVVYTYQTFQELKADDNTVYTLGADIGFTVVKRIY